MWKGVGDGVSESRGGEGGGVGRTGVGDGRVNGGRSLEDSIPGNPGEAFPI